MGVRLVALLCAASAALACGGAESPPAQAAGARPPAEPPRRWWIVDSSSVGAWWDPMVDSATVYRIRVRRGGDSIDLADVVGPLPQVVGGDTVLGLRLRPEGEGVGREVFRVALPSRAVAAWPLPADVFANFTDVALAPDGRHLAYVADAGDATPVAVVRRFPDGAVVIRGPRAAGCECDVDLSHARWVDADSFEIAVVNRAAEADTAAPWLLTAGRVSAGRHRTTGLRGEPTWHEGPRR